MVFQLEKTQMPSKNRREERSVACSRKQMPHSKEMQRVWASRTELISEAQMQWRTVGLSTNITR